MTIVTYSGTIGTVMASDMRFLSQIALGNSQEETTERLDLDMLQKFYGADGDIQHPHPGASGAGTQAEDALFPALGLDADFEDDQEDCSGYSEQELETLLFIRHQLQSQQQKHVRHPPVKVPPSHSPFGSSDQEAVFWEALHEAEEEGYLPRGYGIHPDEWEGGTYPEIELIQTGRRKQGEIEVSLPTSIWFPRAITWAQTMSEDLTPPSTQQPVVKKTSTRNYTLPNDNVLWVAYEEDLFSVHRALMSRASSFMATMIRDAGSPLEGNSIDSPLQLGPHGSKMQWDQFFGYIYVPHHDSPPPERTQEEWIALLSISHKYHVPEAVCLAKKGLKDLGMSAPLQLNLGCRFGFREWVSQASRRIVGIPLDIFTPKELQLIDVESISLLIKHAAKL
ncbi:hypothetical protein FRC07_013677 [Ceratobasidium sp. 392]|nr:hypothetical protein FRC07_013677 [Ceratobasidium sp. 392]